MWKTEKRTDLPLESIRKILDSPLVRKSTIGLEGGEFVLHPQYKEILELLSKRQKFTLLTNGLMSDRLLKSAQEFDIPEILVSCRQ